MHAMELHFISYDIHKETTSIIPMKNLTDTVIVSSDLKAE